ncbi:MAG TPA: tRNA lysidine(34) synthetase TilS [Pyrinomonadaceae bacterium]|jgi:tRNA(Ile)-lysidine synthase
MHKFVRNLLTEWRKLELPFAGETFVVAVSGGADSVSLALALDDLRRGQKLDLRFVLAHFNHDLRGAESARDAEFVKDLAEKVDFELVYGKGNIAKPGNLEQNARFARYEFLTETARKLSAFGILTAHTVNDQAETFLLNLIRGSGIDGLSAMKPVTSDFRFQISDSREKNEIPNPQIRIALVRPLLNWAMRDATENYCHARRIEYRRDAMNDDLNFKRVRIRKILLPLLREFNPKIVGTLAKTAALLRLENAERIVQPAARFLTVRELKELSKTDFYRTLRGWLEANRGSLRQIESKHLEAIERLVFTRKSGRTVELPGGETVVKEGGKLYWKNNIENMG